MKYTSILMLTFWGILLAECRHHKLTEGRKFLESIPKSERNAFLAYALSRGFMDDTSGSSTKQYPFPHLLNMPHELQQKFQALEQPENFTRDLYLFVKLSFRLSSNDMFALILRGKICRPSRGCCIDLGNIGGLCCPF